MQTLESTVDEFQRILENAREQMGGVVSTLYRKNLSGEYIPVLWIPRNGAIAPPVISSASDLAAYLRTEDSPVFSFGNTTFKDGLVRAGLLSFGATVLHICPVPTYMGKHYYLTVGVECDSQREKDALLLNAARTMGELLSKIFLQVQTQHPLKRSESSTATENAGERTCDWSTVEKLMGSESFLGIAETLAESIGEGTEVLIEDANRRELARHPRSSAMPLSLPWMLKPPRLPYLDQLEIANKGVVIPGIFDERGAEKTILPLFEQGDFLGLITIAAKDEPAEEAALRAAQYAAVHLLRCREASRSKVLRDSLNSVENERTRVALELHDETSQNLVALKVLLSTAARALKQGMGDRATLLVEDCARVADEILDSVNRLSSDLWPSELNYLGLKQAIDAAATSRLERVSISHRFSGNALTMHFSPLQESMLLSGVVEALSNCAKHSKATDVSIELDKDSSWFTIAVRDNGIGFDASQPVSAGFGMKTMKDCMTLIGGDFWIGSELGVGTTVRFSVPVRLLEE